MLIIRNLLALSLVVFAVCVSGCSSTDDSASRPAVEAAFQRFDSVVVKKLDPSGNVIVQCVLSSDAPTIRAQVNSKTWYVSNEYDKRKVAFELRSAWERLLQEEGAKDAYAIVRLYDDTATCVAKATPSNTEVYK